MRERIYNVLGVVFGPTSTEIWLNENDRVRQNIRSDSLQRPSLYFRSDELGHRQERDTTDHDHCRSIQTTRTCLAGGQYFNLEMGEFVDRLHTAPIISTHDNRRYQAMICRMQPGQHI